MIFKDCSCDCSWPSTDLCDPVIVVPSPWVTAGANRRFTCRGNETWDRWGRRSWLRVTSERDVRPHQSSAQTAASLTHWINEGILSCSTRVTHDQLLYFDWLRFIKSNHVTPCWHPQVTCRGDRLPCVTSSSSMTPTVVYCAKIRLSTRGRYSCPHSKQWLCHDTADRDNYLLLWQHNNSWWVSVHTPSIQERNRCVCSQWNCVLSPAPGCV